jgi:pimeloyl-ACP methyl ester carboxylesterase
MPSEEPAWFSAAIASEPTHHDVDVDGARIHYRAWGPKQSEEIGLPGIVLLHGGAANSSWWDHIAPQLAVDRRVVAPDLSGHGDSAWKSEYERNQWAAEAVGPVLAEGLDPAVFIGHSMGGWVSVFAAVLRPGTVASIIAIDSPLAEEPPEEAPIAERRPPTKVYPTLEDAVSRFRPVPGQDVVLDYVARHIAVESLREVDGGWTWKFDPGLFGQRGWVRDLIPKLDVPLTLVRCENGMVDEAMAQRISALHRHGIKVAGLPNAAHHAMFDQPEALVAVLRDLLTTPG